MEQKITRRMAAVATSTRWQRMVVILVAVAGRKNRTRRLARDSKLDQSRQETSTMT